MKNLLLILLMIFGFLAFNAKAQNEFITTWQTTDGTITIPTNDESGTLTYNYNITWTNLDNTGLGDGSTTGESGDYTITGLENGDTYKVEITGDFPRLYFNGISVGEREKIMSIEQWGDNQWTTMEAAFYGCSNLTYSATDAPNLSNVTSLYQMFRSCINFNGDLSNWDVSNVTSMGFMFNNASVFNQDISQWNTSQVTSMRGMFSDASAFNQDIGSWDVSLVTSMQTMFLSALAFNQDLGNWDVGNVETMEDMFSNTSLSTRNYDKMLIGWAALPSLQSNVPLKVAFVSFCKGKAAKQKLLDDFNWDIYDIGEDCSGTGFIATWQATDGEITIPTTGTGYNYDISWTNLTSTGQGDGSASGQNADYTITGLTSGHTYEVNIIGDFPRIYFNDGGDKLKIQTIEQWGDIQWTSMKEAFRGCLNLVSNASDAPDLTGVSDMSEMFYGCDAFTGDLSNWNTSNVTNMIFLFAFTDNFNEDISSWDVSGVTNMRYMFANNPVFNQNISSWNTSQVTDMSNMFQNAVAFNQPIGIWDVSTVTNLSAMFRDASTFNQDISDWDVATVVNMSTSFNNASSFDQSLASWNISNVTNLSGALLLTALSTENYDATLASWAIQNVQPDLVFGVGGLTYCNSESFRNTLVEDKGWFFSGDSKDCAGQDRPFITTWQTTDGQIIIPTTGTGYNYNINWTNLTDPGVGDGFSSGESGNYTISGLAIGDTYQVEITGDFPRIIFNENSQVLKIQAIEQWGDIQWASMSRAFSGCSNLVSNAIDNPDLSNVSDFSQMFKGCTNFTGDLSGWNTGNATFMSEMFRGCANFNSDLSGWNVGNVTDMSSLFYGAELFDGDVSNWNVSNVNYMYGIFLSASIFNQDISNWDVSKVQDFGSAFNFAENFNQDLSGWNTTSASNMSGMFRRAFDFDQDLSTWDIRNVTDLSRIFENSSMSINNYDLTLQGWASQTVQDNVSLGAVGVNYCAAETARSTLIDDYGWTINDDGKYCSNNAPTAINLTNNSIDEDNAIGDVIGTLSTTDLDVGDTHTYELVSGNGDTDNVSFTISGSELQAAEIFDFETKTSYSIRVETNDGNGGIFESAFTISITDVDERQEQTITIEPIKDVAITAAAFEVTATTSSSLELSYAILSGPATIAESTVSLTGETGTVEIEASQAGNENFLPATASTSFEVIEDPCADFAATAAVLQNASCNGEVDGSFEVTTTAGTAPFTFSLGNESQDNGLFENQAAGSYEVTVTDANGCTATTTVEITEPAAIEVTAEITDSNSINGNGSITLTVTGGTGSYTYSWDDGATTAAITELEVGTYSVTITDEAGCSIAENYTIGGVTANSEAFEMRMYPNPVANQVEVLHGAGVEQISLLDAKGKIIKQQPTSDDQTTLEMKALPAGLYFIRLDHGKLYRIIKQ